MTLRYSSALLVFAASVLSAQAPKSGRDVLDAMRAAYNGKWYHTLTFTQKTTTKAADGTPRVATWYEALAHTAAGTQLRIDVGEPSTGNGMMYTPDSVIRMREGKVAGRSADGNPFLPLIEGVYVQSVDKTIKELASQKIDMSKVYQTKWAGHPTWVVGAASAADSTSPQFWVDADRQLLTRMILPLAPNAPPYDIHLDGYVKAGGGWLATKIVMNQGGVAKQTEEYTDWKVDVELDPALFDPAKWTTVKHWKK
jgi:hypothetical protein